jgi:nitrite reductase/ring-hydroxylating ferredoxin subunit
MEIHVGSAAAFADPGRRVVSYDGIEIGIFRLAGAFVAYENICPHLGGPACQGQILPRTLEAIDPATKASEGRLFSKEQINVVCPWHGWEFDLHTGRHVANYRMRLRPVDVRVADGEVYVTLPRRPGPTMPVIAAVAEEPRPAA